MATRRSARLQARQQRVKDAVSPETSNYKDPSLFCLCLQPDDGRFMICCDQCNVWFHGDCVGITSAGEKRRAAKDDRRFVCPRLILIAAVLPLLLFILVHLVRVFNGVIKMVILYVNL